MDRAEILDRDFFTLEEVVKSLAITMRSAEENVLRIMYKLLNGRDDISLFARSRNVSEQPDEIISGSEAAVCLHLMVEYPNEKLWPEPPSDWPEKFTWDNMPLPGPQLRSFRIKTNDLIPLLKSKELPEPKAWEVVAHTTGPNSDVHTDDSHADGYVPYFIPVLDAVALLCEADPHAYEIESSFTILKIYGKGAPNRSKDECVEKIFWEIVTAEKNNELPVTIPWDTKKSCTSTGEIETKWRAWDKAKIAINDLIKWARKKGIPIPEKLKLLVSQNNTSGSIQSKQKTSRTPTQAANQARQDTGKERREKLREFSDIVYAAGARTNRGWAIKGGPINYAKNDFLTVFLEHYPDFEEVAFPTMKDDLKEIGIKFASGKRATNADSLRQVLKS